MLVFLARLGNQYFCRVRVGLGLGLGLGLG